MRPLLSVEEMAVSYGAAPAVRNVSLEIFPGEVRVILGANGAGKSTIIKALLGLQKSRAGKAIFGDGRDLLRLRPHEVHQLGIAWAPEGRQLWGTLTVLDNLRMGGFLERDKERLNRRIDEMFRRFPRLGERRHQLAGLLSGGEQQMVAIARALMMEPKLLLLDEPSLGLAPILVREVFELVREINSAGVSVLMVEQNARQALKVASWAYLLEVGSIVESGPSREIAAKERVQAVFLGGEA